MKLIKVPAMLEVQRGRLMASTTFNPAQLAAYGQVDHYDPTRGSHPNNGYQRRPSETRINQAASFYGEGVERRNGREFDDRRGLMPNPIIANVRMDPAGVPNDLGLPPGVHLDFQAGVDRELIRRAIEDGGNATANCTITLDEDVIVWEVDGQHRDGAVDVLAAKGRIAEDFPVPVKLLLGFERDQEIVQFFYINSQAKSVPTDLTAELVQQMASRDAGEEEYLAERKGKAGLLAGGEIYRAMEQAGSPWLSRIRRPNEKISKDTSIAVSQFINSLAPLRSAQMPRTLTAEEWARVIDSFWAAIAVLLPQPFDPAERPGDWVLLKATGVNTLHRVLADCLPIVIQRGGRLAEQAQYESLLADLPSLSGVGIDPMTGEERQVDGSEFWRSASIASQFTGRYGTDRLVGQIRGLMARSNSSVVV